ncbi:cytochrome P450 [Mycena maculata]|uniref:Cytochrome P450 n=1 Tax=Mycena maculata TaxID=230809 RepID=A0AAD7KA12_9AGAR|nr:cytochrome P450 [Mycena maculata]
MVVASDLLLPLLGSVICYGLFRVASFLYREFTSPLRLYDLPGPRSPSLWYGSFNELAADQHLMDSWREKYGRNFQFRGLFNISELHTSDPKAMAHIVGNTVTYQKSPASRYNISRMLGNGILAVELDEHKYQRKIMTPAFGVKHTRDLTPVFVQHANELRDYWIAELAKENDVGRMDVFAWLRRTALDVIGETGFNYKFDSLNPNGKPSEMMEALTKLFHSSGSQRNFVFRFAQANFPILRFLPMPNRDAKIFFAAQKRLFEIGAKLVAESKTYIEAAGGEKNAGSRQDLLSLLMRANLATDLPESERLTDEAVIAQVPSFVVAGHENTSSGTAWTLHQLTLNPEIQSKLREELLAVPSETPTFEQLNAIPYLENVIRETMRLHAPVDFTGRMVMEDDVLPLQTPFVDKKGKIHTGIPVRKGQKIHMPIRALNVDKSLWGEDAEEFKPERWDNLPEAVTAIPSVYANLFTFYAGAHSCIGFRFSIMEQKALLFSLVRTFEFEKAVPEGAIGRTSATALQKPIVLAERSKGSQMPLILKLYRG